MLVAVEVSKPIAAVRRIRSPGTKFDQIVVLEGPQGCGKSTFVQILAGGAELFTDALRLGAQEKETIEITAGKIIVELGELRDASKRDLSAIKHFASRQADRARLSYDVFASEIPRQFTIWGTTNDSEYLADPWSWEDIALFRTVAAPRFVLAQALALYTGSGWETYSACAGASVVMD